MERQRLNTSQRNLGTIEFSQGAVKSIDIPRDSFFKSFNIVIAGSVITTFASGSPAAVPTSTMDILITEIQAKVNNRTVKSVRPYMQRMNNYLFTGTAPERLSSAAAAAAVPANYPTVEAGFTYGTTTQYSSFRDSIQLNFEVPVSLADNGIMTILNTKKASSAELKFTFGSFSNMEGTSTTVAVAYTGLNISLEITAEEIQDLPADTPTYDYRQSFLVDQLTAQATNREIDINRGNILLGISIIVESNIGSTGSVEAFKKLNNAALTNIGFKVNGKLQINDTPFVQKQRENKNKFGVYAPFASNVSPFDGYVFMNFIENRNVLNGLDLQEADSAKLVISSLAALAATPFVTYPLNLTIETHELALIA